MACPAPRSGHAAFSLLAHCRHRLREQGAAVAWLSLDEDDGPEQMRVDSHPDDRDLKLTIQDGDPWTRAEWKLRTYLRGYLRVVYRLDKNVGWVPDYLEISGFDEGTLVVCASGQGIFLGEHGLFNKRWFREESIRFPLIVRPPASGSAVCEIVSQTDVVPTLLEITDLEVPDDMQGSLQRRGAREAA